MELTMSPRIGVGRVLAPGIGEGPIVVSSWSSKSHSFLQNLPSLMVWVPRTTMGFCLEMRVGPEDQKNQRLRKSSHMTSCRVVTGFVVPQI